MLEGAHFVDADRGWTAEDGGRIRHWNHLLQVWDYGETPDDARDPLRGVFFLDELQPLHGWAVGEEGTILKSTDGGATWSRANTTPILNRNTQPTPAHLNTIFMHDVNNGWVGGDDGTFYNTTNGWVTWSYPSGCTLPPLFNTSTDPQDIYKIKFHDSLNGFLAADYGDALTTSDGGCTWVPADIFGA